MTDLFLMGIFVLCIVIGYIVVKRSGGILEHMLFRNSNSWYNLRESNEPCRDAGAGNACSQAISRDGIFIGRMPVNEKNAVFRLKARLTNRRTFVPGVHFEFFVPNFGKSFKKKSGNAHPLLVKRNCLSSKYRFAAFIVSQIARSCQVL